MTDNDQIVELLREIRDAQRSHLEAYRQFTSEAISLSRESVSRQPGVNWQRITAFVIYSLALIGAGAFFGSIISDLARIQSP